MTVAPIFQGITAAQALPNPAQNAPPGSNLPPGSAVIFPGGGAGTPVGSPGNQTFQAVLNGSGSCSATVQLVVSNDGINWMGYGSITIASGQTPNSQPFNATQAWAYYSGFVSAIAGTNAKCSLFINV